MPHSDPTSFMVHELSAAIQARRLSPVDVVEAYLARIEAHEPKLHAFVEVYADDARLAAEAADKAIRSGHAVGPLHGIPIALEGPDRDRGQVVDRRLRGLARPQAARTATLARRLVAQGMIVLGKTHTVEFAMGGWGTNQHLGTPWNPWDPRRASHARRVEQRLGRRGRRGPRAVGDRHRYRRLGAAARLLVRHHRAEDHDRPRQHLRRPAA